MNWEKKYLETLMELFRPAGNVLQMGFGNGHAAELIQKFRPKSHVIFEIESEAVKKGSKWAAAKSSVQFIEEGWEEALPQCELFDAVFFNEPHSFSEPDLGPNFFTSELLKEGEKLLEEVSSQIPELVRIRYLDPELEAFCQSVASSSKEHLSRFLGELEENGQITEDQRKKNDAEISLEGAERGS